MRALLLSIHLLAAALAAPAAAKESLGVFGDWGAFRDPGAPRCYAIAAAQDETRASLARHPQAHAPFASVGTWPARGVRGQFHLRLSRNLAPGTQVRLAIGRQRFDLVGSGADAWAKDHGMDAAILAAMRSATSMSVSARSDASRSFTDRYSLDGAPTALDAATLGCAGRR